MVAEYRQEPAPLPLLFEPDRPEAHGRAERGWSRTERIRNRIRSVGLHRRHEHDPYGAQIQHAIARYVLGGERRSALAAELSVSETHFQYMLRGATWGAYTRPVLRALRRLGITTGRGDWKIGARRAREIVAAQRSVMLRAIQAVDGAPPTPAERERLLADLYLLTIASGDDQ